VCLQIFHRVRMVLFHTQINRFGLRAVRRPATKLLCPRQVRCPRGDAASNSWVMYHSYVEAIPCSSGI
jgi:hypothetical protein